VDGVGETVDGVGVTVDGVGDAVDGVGVAVCGVGVAVLPGVCVLGEVVTVVPGLAFGVVVVLCFCPAVVLEGLLVEPVVPACPGEACPAEEGVAVCATSVELCIEAVGPVFEVPQWSATLVTPLTLKEFDTPLEPYPVFPVAMLPAFPVCELLIAPVLAFAPALAEPAFADPDASEDPASRELLLLMGSPMTSTCSPTCMRRSVVFPARW